MSTIKQFPNGTFQVRISSHLLDKPIYATFSTRSQAESHGLRIEGLLAQGVVSIELIEPREKGRDRNGWTIAHCIAEYLRNDSVPVSDIKLLDTIRPLLSSISTNDLTLDWCETWISDMKRVENLSPSTIRHRYGALARCLDWLTRKHPGIVAQNPLRQLKRGFSSYTEEDNKRVIADGKQPKFDIERDRRLAIDEEQRILKILENMPDERMFFILALESAMRMRECYTLEIDQVNLGKRTIYLDRTKNGDNRQIPLSNVATSLLDDHLHRNANQINTRQGRIFSFWNGSKDERELDNTTREVSRVFSKIFSDAEIIDLHFHDLRHEAICRLYEKTSLPDVLIAKITGHRNLNMLRRYASLRGSDLAIHLW